jgi:anthranilate synthase/indole-3-glycerol phosphate synthase/phosphoribosylanthranilate isomerase
MAAVDVLFIDNYDSFSYNLVQYLQEMKADVTVYRNDKITLDEAIALNPRRVVVSPGPGAPKDAGVSCEIIRHFSGKVPVFGVCLGEILSQQNKVQIKALEPVFNNRRRAGLQCMFEVFGGVVSHAGEIVHGKTSEMTHDGKGCFEGAFTTVVL